MSVARVSPELLHTLYVQAMQGPWRAAPGTFAAAIETAVARRFGHASASQGEVQEFVTSLHLADLALACACRDGDERAWEHVMREYRPALRTAARTMARDGSAEELADSLFAELYAGRSGGGEPVLAYYHGRARLLSWLRTVLAQRYVDRQRAARRTVGLDEAAIPAAADAGVRDPHRADYIQLVQRALDEAVASLAADDRLRLRLYYGGAMTLAQVGRVVGEHEATVSRKLERARQALRRDVEARLARQGLAPAAIEAALDAARSASDLDASRLLGRESE